MRARLKEARASCKFLSAHWFSTWVGGPGGGGHANRLFLQPFVRQQPADLAPRDLRFDILAMNRDDAPDFRPRTGRIRDHGRASARRSRSFVAQVMKAAAKANGGPLTQAQFTGGKPRARGSGRGGAPESAGARRWRIG